MNKNDLLVDSTGYILNLLEKVLDTKIVIKGMQNIPKNNPRVFVANHFTRIEALLVPYALYDITNKKVGVIADDSLFDSVFADLLSSIGALKKSNPYINNIILGDLLSSSKDLMIFPEGLMVKGKDISKQNNNYCVKIDNICQRVYTGSAFFALYSQLLRNDYFTNNIKNIKKFQRKYFLKNTKDINKNETMIIPINISYSKIRSKDNFLMAMLENIFDDTSEIFKEEIKIESNLILNSTISINILKPISINDILEDAYEKEKNHSKIINNLKEDLTHTFMNKIYENLTISFDHVFILILFLYPKSTIKIEHFKRLIYIICNKIKQSSQLYTKDIKNNMINLISYEKYIVFEDILNIAIKDNIIKIKDNTYKINKKNLINSHTHNTIRLKNILRVILNEIVLIKNIYKLTLLYSYKSEKYINNELFDILNEEEEKEYKEDYTKYEKRIDIKDPSIGKSFLLKANSTTCIIALHGFSSAPKEVRKLSIYLNTKELNVYAPRLKGHGTVSEDLKNTTWLDWYNSLSRAIIMCSLKYEKIYLLGFSTGGLLTLLSAKKSYKEFLGIICINAALNLNDIRVKTLIPAVKFWNDILISFHAKEYVKEYINNVAQNPKINYNKHYINSINQLKELMAKTKTNLKKVKKPILIIQSSDDPVVNPSSAYEIFEKIKSENKKLEIIDSKLHVIITKKNKKLFRLIKNFILALE